MCCRRYDFLANLVTYPTYTCIIAYSGAYDYDQVGSKAEVLWCCHSATKPTT